VYGGEDMCREVTCPGNHCLADGSAYLYNCECDSRDGECYCDEDICTQGCNAIEGGCVLLSGGLCGGVDCGDDYCLEDQKTRFYNCQCDPDDGGCYCLSEVCEAGCNMATGRCVESMVIDGGSSGDDDYIFYDDSNYLIDTLGIIGGVAAGGGVLFGGGYLGYKAIQGMLAKRAFKSGAKMAGKAAAEAAEPSLRELFAEFDRTSSRATQSVDKAESAVRGHELRYREMVKRHVNYDEKWANEMARRAALIEKAEYGVKVIKKGADVTADIVGNVPGAGDVFKYGYNLSTTAAESIASGDTAGQVLLKTTSKGVETFAGDRLFGKVTVLDGMAKTTVKQTVKQAIKQNGAENLILEGLKNEGTNNMMNLIKEVKNRSVFGKIDRKLADAATRVDRKAVGRTLRRVLYRK